MKATIDAIRKIPDCIVLPPSGVPMPDGPLVLPDDLRAFFVECGGVTLFRSKDYWIEIVRPGDFLPSNSVVRGDRAANDISDTWYRVARQDLQENISIDLHPTRLGRCYDSFWDRHAIRGECPVIARTFTELLQRLFLNEGRHWYWLQSGFQAYGDAYDAESA